MDFGHLGKQVWLDVWLELGVVVAHTYNPSTWEAEAEWLLRVQGQPGLDSDFQASLSYSVRKALPQTPHPQWTSRWEEGSFTWTVFRKKCVAWPVGAPASPRLSPTAVPCVCKALEVECVHVFLEASADQTALSGLLFSWRRF